MVWTVTWLTCDVVEPFRTEELLSIMEVFVEVPTAPFAGWNDRSVSSSFLSSHFTTPLVYTKLNTITHSWYSTASVGEAWCFIIPRNCIKPACIESASGVELRFRVRTITIVHVNYLFHLKIIGDKQVTQTTSDINIGVTNPTCSWVGRMFRLKLVLGSSFLVTILRLFILSGGGSSCWTADPCRCM